MKNTNKNILKAAALTTVAATMTVAVLPVNAETANEDVTKNEDVFVVLNADGSVNTTTVSDTLHSDSGFSNYDDKSNLTNAQNLKSTDALAKSSDGYTWNTDAKDIYYQGSYSGNLPLGVSISYTLDGKSISEEDLLGKSGHVVITMNLTNNKYKFYSVNGKSYKVAMPIAAVTGAMLNKDVFSNVTVNEGKVTSDSAHDIVAKVSLPGMKDSLESLVTANALSSIEEYLTDEVVIEADADSYEAPEIMLAASTNTEELKTELGGTDLSAVWGDMDKLQSATQELIDGTKALYDGADALSNGATQLDAGAQKLVDGATSLESGANQVSDGASTLETGLGQLSANSATLNAGAKQIEDGVFASATTGLNESSAVASSGVTYTLTPTNYSEVLGGLLGIAPADRESAFNTIASKLRATAAGSSLTDDQINALIYMATVHTTGDFEKDLSTQAVRMTTAYTVAGVKTTISDQVKKAIAGGVPQANAIKYVVTNDSKTKDYLTVAEVKFGTSNVSDTYDDILSSAKTAYPGYDESTVALLLVYGANYVDWKTKDLVTTAKSDLEDATAVSGEITSSASETGKAYINGTLDAIVAQYKQPRKELTDLLNQLNGVVQFVEGLKTYTAGVDQAYAGSQTLAAGASQLSDGASSLATGASQLKTGINTLSTGINTLRDGAKTLMDGMQQYDTDGISKLTDSTEVSDIKNATQLLKQIKQDSDDYNNYSGISEGTTGTVKFVYKVKTVKTEKDDSTASTNSDVTHVNDGSNIWSRIINLFVFWK